MTKQGGCSNRDGTFGASSSGTTSGCRKQNFGLGWRYTTASIATPVTNGLASVSCRSRSSPCGLSVAKNPSFAPLVSWKLLGTCASFTAREKEIPIDMNPSFEIRPTRLLRALMREAPRTPFPAAVDHSLASAPKRAKRNTKTPIFDKVRSANPSTRVVECPSKFIYLPQKQRRGFGKASSDGRIDRRLSYSGDINREAACDSGRATGSPDARSYQGMAERDDEGPIDVPDFDQTNTAAAASAGAARSVLEGLEPWGAWLGCHQRNGMRARLPRRSHMDGGRWRTDCDALTLWPPGDGRVRVRQRR